MKLFKKFKFFKISNFYKFSFYVLFLFYPIRIINAYPLDNEISFDSKNTVNILPNSTDSILLHIVYNKVMILASTMVYLQLLVWIPL